MIEVRCTSVRGAGQQCLAPTSVGRGTCWFLGQGTGKHVSAVKSAEAYRLVVSRLQSRMPSSLEYEGTLPNA